MEPSGDKFLHLLSDVFKNIPELLCSSHSISSTSRGDTCDLKSDLDYDNESMFEIKWTQSTNHYKYRYIDIDYFNIYLFGILFFNKINKSLYI